MATIPALTGEQVRTLRAVICGLIAASASACASQPNPIIDTKGVDMAAYRRDLAECTKYAEEIHMAAGAAKGAAAGSAYGAAVGSIHGRASEGAGTGAISGAAWSMLDADREKQQVVKRCVAGRGYHVLN
jgi:hypothetical protein